MAITTVSTLSTPRIQPPLVAPVVNKDTGAPTGAWLDHFQQMADQLAVLRGVVDDIKAGLPALSHGVTDGSDAAAGDKGEYISASAAISSVGLGFSAATNVCSISLTAGDWDAAGVVHFTSSAGNMAIIAAWVNNASASEPSQPSPGYASMRHATNGFYATQTVLALSPRRFSLAATTTVYLGALATFASGVVAAGGFVGARRVR